MNAPRSERMRAWGALSVILILAAALRFWGAFHDLPYIYHPDEPVNIASIVTMVDNGDPNPHDFRYPSLLYDVNAVGGAIYVALRSLVTGAPATLAPPLSIAMASTFAPSPDAIVLFRSLTVGMGVLSVLLVFLIGRRAAGAAVGLGAALLAAVAPVLVADSRLVTPDTYMLAMALATIYCSLRVLESGRVLAYVAAGCAVGATAAAKYNGALVCVAVIAAHVGHFGLAPRHWWRLALAGSCSIVGFLVLMPFAALDFSGFMAGWTSQVGFYSGRHDGMDGSAAIWYAQDLWITGGVTAVLAIAELARRARRPDALAICVASFGVVYLAFISTFNLRNDRTLLPVVPCMILLACAFYGYLASAESPLRRVSAPLRRSVLLLLGLAMLVAPLRLTIERTLASTRIDSRATAREWINSALPEHAVVAVESYAPFVSPLRFRIVESERAIDHPPAWYAQNADYLVLSEGLFGRYFSDPGRYAAEIARYRQLMQSFELVRSFADGGYHVMVYSTRSAPLAGQ